MITEDTSDEKGARSEKNEVHSTDPRISDLEMIQRHWEEIPLEERRDMFNFTHERSIIDEMYCQGMRRTVAERLRKKYPDEVI